MKKRSCQNILVPIDFSPMSIEALASAKILAERLGAIIHLVHVHHVQYPVGFRGPVLSRSEYAVSFEEHRKEALLKDLHELARRNHLGPASTVHLCEGVSVYREICRRAQQSGVDLIVISTHGRTALGQVLLGSTAERIVQHSPCPVLVTRTAKTKTGKAKKAVAQPRSILVPVDFSDTSLAALEYAIEFTADTPAKLIILHVIDLGDALSTDGMGVYRLADVREIAREEAERKVADLPQKVDLGKIPFETVIKNGKPVPEICALAEERGVDLIIASTHGRTGLEHLLIGSVAEQVVRHADRSVLVVPAHLEARAEGLIDIVRQARQGDKAEPSEMVFFGRAAGQFAAVRL
ncbi:MAG: universal stress protein [Chthoniobacterales bacterium]